MEAYYVHDPKKETDSIILPALSCRVTVDAAKLREFIAVNPDFSTWSGEACGDLSPEDFGEVVATRTVPGDVCIVNQELWPRRMAHYLD